MEEKITERVTKGRGRVKEDRHKDKGKEIW